MLTLNECKKILLKDGETFTDEEIIEIRNWVDTMVDIALSIVEQNGIDAINEIIDRENRQPKD
jgi:uncharacterized protein with PhoU and TrkA domain